MTTIEDKIRLFSKIIYDKIKEEKQVEFDSFEEERAVKLAELKVELEAKQSEEIQEAIKRAKIKAVEKISREKIKFQQKELALREDMMRQVMEELKDYINCYTETDEYYQVLLKGIRRTLEELNENQYTLYLTKKDISKVEKSIDEYCKALNINITVKETESTALGGFMLEDNGRKFRIDYSLRSKLNEQKNYIGLRISENSK